MKPICFNDNCKKNLTVTHEFKDDQEIFKYSVAQIQKNEDFESLLCAEAETQKPIVLPHSHELSGASPQFVMQNLEWFSCLFVLDTSDNK